MKVWISREACSITQAQSMDIARPANIKINEIFFSIQGESSWAGYPTVFVRTSGCHLRCTYCDTTYAYHDGQMMSADEIVARVQSYPAEYVCITGGEPLLQSGVYELMRRLCDLNFRVSLETSGDKSCAAVDPRVKKIIDVKTPDSGEPGRFDPTNLLHADRETEFKFVITSEKDFLWAEQFAVENKLFEKSNVLYSPSFKIPNTQEASASSNEVAPRWLAEKILAAKSKARLQVQLHKYIWSADARGV